MSKARDAADKAPVAATLTGTETLTNKTLDTPNITNGLTIAGSAGSAGQVLQSNGSSAPSWGTPSTATTATNLAGGGAGQVPYQSGAGTTAFLAAGTNGYFLQSTGAGAPVWAAAGASINYAAKSTTYTAVAGDKGYLFGCTSTWTLSLTAATTLGNGWFLYLQNLGTGVITVDPNGAETIGGVATANLNPGDIWLIVCNGTNFQLERLNGNNYQIFTSSGTFTVPAGVYRIYAEAWGGGGGGGKINTYLPPGGGGGGYSAGWINVTPGQTITATVGSGGSAGGGYNSAGAGGNGGASTFGVLTANGGIGGVGSGSGSTVGHALSAGGTASGGDINIRGGVGAQVIIALSSGERYSRGGDASNGGLGGATWYLYGTDSSSLQEPSIPGGGGGSGSWAPNLYSQDGARGEIRVYWV